MAKAHHKQFSTLKISGAYCERYTIAFCKDCIYICLGEKIRKDFAIKQALKDLSERDKFSIEDYDKIEYRNLNSHIEFVCCCGTLYSKQFTAVKKSGGFCHINMASNIHCNPMKSDKKGFKMFRKVW